MRPFDLNDWQRWQQQGCTRLPAVLVSRDESLPQSWERLAIGPATALLESAQAGRYSYFCDRPARVIVGDAARTTIVDGEGAPERVLTGRPLEILHALLCETKAPALPGWPAMTGGLIGVLGYDAVHSWEKLPMTATRDLAIPLYAFIETRELFIYDHAERTLGIVVWTDAPADSARLAEQFNAAQSAAHRALHRWRERGAAFQPPTFAAEGRAEAPHDEKVAAPPPSLSGEAFRSAVRRAQDYIAAGHTYQVNLSRRTSRATSLAPTAIYEALRRVNPSPYMGLLRLPEFALVCGSPELLVKLNNGIVSSRPIAGTRPRGEGATQDAHFSAELFASEKERAEHLMLVDLIRNDIGRVAEFGSVRVSEFMALERYSHVMHIVSQVEGRLARGKTWVDVFRSMFPGGTITGCPKFRTMEIIEELEPVGRGFYTGALGWISYGGEMEMNIVIRSMLVKNGVAHVQAGAGIVADSQPARELDEATRKAQALWVALDAAEAAHAVKSHG